MTFAQAWLSLHVGFYLVAYALLGLLVVSTFAYLQQYRQLKAKRVFFRWPRFFSLQFLQKLHFRLLAGFFFA